MTLIAKYSFHQNVLDSSGNNEDLTNIGVTFTTGVIGQAGDFDGSSYVITTNDFDPGVGSFSATIWSKNSGSANHEVLISRRKSTGEGWELSKGVSNNYRFTLHDGTNLIDEVFQAITTGTWECIVITYNNSTREYYAYVNNIQAGNQTQVLLTDAWYIAAFKLEIGARYNTGITKVTGQLDEAKYYDHVITATERKRDYFETPRKDIWIGSTNKSYGNKLIKCTSIDSINLASGRFTASLRDRNRAIKNAIDYENDVKIFIRGILKFRGKIEQIDYKQRRYLNIIGKDYASILLERNVVNKSFTSKTRQYIIWHLIGLYLTQLMGSVFFAIVGSHTGATSTTVLIDSTSSFTSYNIVAGDRVVCLTDQETATVVTVDSAIQITTTTLSGSASYNSDDDYAIMKDTVQDIISEIKGDGSNPFYIDNKPLAKIFLEFADEENSQLYIRPTISGDILPLYYVPINYVSSGITLDFNTISNSTSGHFPRRYRFEKDSKQIKNVFTVYSAASFKVGATVRDEPSITTYGEKHARPVIDVNATTPAMCRIRAKEVMNKWQQVLNKGSLTVRDHEDFSPGETILVTVATEEYDLSEFLMWEIEHSLLPSFANLKLIELIRGSEQVIADQIKLLGEVDFRDADPTSLITQYINQMLVLNIAWTVTLSEASSTASSSKIGQIRVGKMAIGDPSVGASNDVFADQTMIYAHVGKNYIRDIICGENTTYLDSTNGYIGVGSVAGHSVASTKLNTEVDRKVVTVNNAINYEVEWSSTFGNVDIPDQTAINEIAIFNALSNGIMPCVYSLTSPYTKIDGNDITIDIKATLTMTAGSNLTITNNGRNATRNMISNNGSTILNITNAHLGTDDDTQTGDLTTKTALDSEYTTTRATIDSAADLLTNTPAKVTWNFTIANAEVADGIWIKAIGLFDASTSGTLIAIGNVNNVQKVGDNDIVYAIIGEMQE